MSIADDVNSEVIKFEDLLIGSGFVDGRTDIEGKIGVRSKLSLSPPLRKQAIAHPATVFSCYFYSGCEEYPQPPTAIKLVLTTQPTVS